MRVIGVKRVICTCDKDMERTGGVFGSSVTYSTYVCRACKKAVNVIDTAEQEDFFKDLELKKARL